MIFTVSLVKTGPLPDTDTVELLKRAMRAFRGGFAVVSHSEKLIEEAARGNWLCPSYFWTEFMAILISFNGDLGFIMIFFFNKIYV